MELLQAELRTLSQMSKGLLASSKAQSPSGKNPLSSERLAGEESCKVMSVKNNEEKSAASPQTSRNHRNSSSAVAVLGSLHLDIMVNAPDRPKGRDVARQRLELQAGGKGGNQAVAAAQFGAQAFMIGRVGDDDFGKRLLSHLQVLRSTRSTCEPTRTRVPE